MKRVQTFKLTAPLLRIILSVTMLLVVVLGFFVWRFGTHYLDTVAANVAKVAQESNASNHVVSQLQNLQKQLADTKDAQQKAANIVAQSSGYHFQNQITEDLTRFAGDAGVSIQSFTFSGGVKASPGAAGASGATPSAQPTTPLTTAPSIAGLTPVTVTITLRSPIDYNAYLRFLNDIEHNSLKMQVSGLSLSSGADGLTSQDLTIQAYIN